MIDALFLYAPDYAFEARHGYAVENGIVNLLSVSQLQKAALCERRWFFDKVLHIKEPKTKATDTGLTVHKQLEHFAKTGDPVLGDIALPMQKFLPAPGSDLLTEWAFNDEPAKDENGWFPPEESKLHAADIPLVGFVDLINLRDPKRPRITDHKTTSDIDAYGAKAEQLNAISIDAIRGPEGEGNPGAAIQMVGYAEFLRVAGHAEGAEVIELEHIYGQTGRKGRRGEHVVAALTPQQAADEWGGKVVPLAERLTELAQETSPAAARPNWNACSKYGRYGCPYQSQCLTLKETN